MSWQPHKFRDDLEFEIGSVKHDLLVLENSVINMPSSNQTMNLSHVNKDQNDGKTQHPGNLEELTVISSVLLGEHLISFGGDISSGAK